MKKSSSYKSFRINNDYSRGLLKIRLTPRSGDKRSYYIRTNLDGRFVHGKPHVTNKICSSISKLLPKKTKNEVVVGFAEGSIILAYNLARIRNSSFACSTKTQRSDLKTVIEFMEEHRSHIPSHYLYSLQKNDDIILVEDEISTGKTIINAFKQLVNFGFTVKAVASIIEITNFGGRNKIKDATGLALTTLTTITLL